MSDTAPVRPEERFDESRVSRYLTEHLPDLFPCDEVLFDQFHGGAANLTYRARCADGTEYVLRRAPLGQVARGGHDMEREHRVLSRLWRRFSLAPRAFHYCDDPAVMGKPFFVMERRRGHVVRKTWPDAFATDTDMQRTVAESLVDALGDLHAIEPRSVDLESLGRPEGFVERQIAGWTSRWFACATRPVREMEVVSSLLVERAPEPQRTAILHNDYKLDNTMIGEDGRLVAVFDWDMATLGDPLVDLGTLLAYWVQPDDPTYLVFGANAVAIGEVMSKDAVAERYANRCGLDLVDSKYYEALALFRIAVIIEQIYARYVQGQTTDERFASFQPIAPLLAVAALDAIDR